MFRGAITLGFLMSLTALSACAEDDVDPELDIIAGEMDAPHSLVVYFSPGCATCLQIMNETTDDLTRRYVDPGHLRLIYRDVPQLFSYREGQDDYNQRARQASHDYGYSLRCYQHVGDSAGYLQALDIFRDELSDLRETYASEYQDWPVITGDFLMSFSQGRTERSPFSAQQLGPCQAGEHLEEAASAFERNADLLVEAAGDPARVVVPAYFLDGEPIGGSNQGAVIAGLERALERMIPEAGE